ncbi:hypothetical protein KI387_017745, partial [Taxus chinensis]
MAAGCASLECENQTDCDRYPLLMEHPLSSPNADHVVVNVPASSSPMVMQTERRGNYQILVSDSHQLSASSECDVEIPVNSLETTLSTAEVQSRLPPSSSSLRNSSFGRNNSFGRIDDFNNYGSGRQRTSPLNSGLWISMELTITVSQIIASIIVLSLSRHENPQAPLHVWVLGYAVGCFATLPLLYWRYSHRYANTAEQDPLSSSGASHSSVLTRTSSYGVTSAPQFSQEQEAGDTFQPARSTQDTSVSDARINIFVERFKMALDCFFAIWFVVGNVWIFGGHSSSSEAPNLYRLCIVFLTFSCIGYAMPFILCATICCCLPCIISLLGFREDQTHTKGASSEVINSLPTYKFKGKGESGETVPKDDIESDSESSSVGGVVAAGTENERAVSAEDAICCICLGKYKDDVELRELPCLHHFHVDCVDKWLKINATCPLCKHEISDSSEVASESAGEMEQQRDRSSQNE